MFRREHLIKPIRPFYEITDLIKVLIGIRRCGKSVLLTQIYDELLAKGIDKEHIIFVNFELLDFEHLKTAKSLHNYVVSQIKPNEKYFVFLDEIQLVDEFELAVNSLRARENISIFITGSNAHLLSGDLATHLFGSLAAILGTVQAGLDNE